MFRDQGFITIIIILTATLTYNSADYFANNTLRRFLRQSPNGLLEDGCILPKEFLNGRYILTGNYIPGKKISDGTFVTIECNSSYVFYPDKFSACSDNNWTPKFPRCVRSCPAISSTSVEITCEIDDKKIPCSKPVPEGGIARMKCKLFYQHLHSVNPVIRCREGSWDNPVIKCAPECGQEIPSGQPLIINGISATKGKFPWHVGIYRKKSAKDNFENICGGSLISEKVVLTAAHCFIDERFDAFINVSYSVGAGKYYSAYMSSLDPYAQYIAVKDVKLRPEYRGIETNYQDDIAIVITEKPFRITQFVMPVCIDWLNEFESFQLEEDKIGIVLGWGFTEETGKSAHELKQLYVPYKSRISCLQSVPHEFTRFITADKFCGGYTNGSAVCNGDSGGGLFYHWPKDNKYYIRGIVSISPLRESACDSQHYAAYTRMTTDILRWLSDTESANRIHYNIKIVTRIQEPSELSGCELPDEIPNGSYGIEKYVPSVVSIGQGTLIKIQCNENYTAYPKVQISTCLNSYWEPEIPRCVRNCPAIIAENADLYCDLNGIKQNCSKPMVDGTTVYMTCKMYFQAMNNQKFARIKCNAGYWNLPILKCVPECGVTYYLGPVPWHVAIFQQETRETDFKYICGGSVITQKIVLTAASCFTRDEDGVYVKANYRIGAGKPIQSYTDDEIVQFKQFRDVKQILIQPDYRGRNNTYQNDIAIAVVREPFEIITIIKPVCVDLYNELGNEQKITSMGIVVNFGVKENYPDTLIRWNLLPKDRDTCISDFPAQFKQFVTPDKFCTKIEKDTNICSEIAGGSFSLFSPKERKYYIRGIINIGPLNKGECNLQEYIIYTRLTNPILNWIRDVESKNRIY